MRDTMAIMGEVNKSGGNNVKAGAWTPLTKPLK